MTPSTSRPPLLPDAQDDVERLWRSGQTIAVPVAAGADLSRVVPVAAWFAERLGRPIEVVTVVGTNGDITSAFSDLIRATERLSERSRRRLRGRLLISDEQTSTVLEACRDRLVVMETSASAVNHRQYVGSYASAIVGRSTAPVVVVGPGVDSSDKPDFDSMVVALGSPDGGSFLPLAQRLAKSLELELRALHVVEDPGSTVEQTLIEAADTSLLVMATRNRSVMKRLEEGSVSFSVVGAATKPVVLVGPHVGKLSPATPRIPVILPTSGTPDDAIAAVQSASGPFNEITYTPGPHSCSEQLSPRDPTSVWGFSP